MKKGDIVQINGQLGFLLNPKMEVKEAKGGLVLLRSVEAKEGGLLSHLNENWYGIDYIIKRANK